MHTTHLIALIGMSVFAQSALANTIWLKDTSTPKPEICRNSLISNPNNPEKIIGLGGVNRDGSSFTLTIDNPPPTVAVPNPVTPATGACQSLPQNLNANPANNPSGNPIVFSGSMQPRLTATHMWKEWMAQTSSGSMLRKECLDQGSNLSGLSGTINSGQYRLLLSTQFTDGCDMQSQTKSTADGQPLIVRTATIFLGGERPIYTGTYHIFNVDSVPEPGTIMLLVIGAATLGMVAFTRRRQTKGQHCRPELKA